MFETICSKVNPDCKSTVLEQTIQLSVEIAREGREGRKIGTMFVIGDEESVLKKSRPLILDPLKGHSPEEKMIADFNMRETVKELAQLDGAFVISSEGVIVSAARFINADTTKVNLPMGLGTRHIAAAAITLFTRSVAIVVSESSVVRIFSGGEIIAEIIPEIWMMGRESIPIEGPYVENRIAGLRILARDK